MGSEFRGEKNPGSFFLLLGKPSIWGVLGGGVPQSFGSPIVPIQVLLI